MPIRLRLALAGIAVAGLALLVFGFAFDRLVVVGAPAEQDKQLSALADRAVVQLAGASAEQLASGLSPVATDPSSSDEPFLVVVADDGAVSHSSATLDGAIEAIPSAIFAQAQGTGTAAATVEPAGGPELRLQVRPWERPDLGMAGFVIAGQATRFAEQQVVGFRAVLIVAGIVALIGAGAASWFVSGRALRPLRDLASTADEIGRTGDLTRRLPPARGKDVVGALTTSFNGMLERLEAARQHLAEALESQRRFVADASHELRGPLTSVRSNAGFLLEHPDAVESDRREALGDIEAEVERMGRLVDGLLTLARADAGHPLERIPVDLGRLAEDVGRRSRHVDRPIQLDLDGPAIVIGDRDALDQLLWILVDNAARYGGGEIEVRVSPAGDDVMLKVADRGPGVPADDLDRIFERFYRADPARASGGAGLGLSIARWIAEAHGGSISAGNRDRGGAVFAVRLPSALKAPTAGTFPPAPTDLPPAPVPPASAG